VSNVALINLAHRNPAIRGGQGLNLAVTISLILMAFDSKESLPLQKARPPTEL
jgi:hypothetical protein